MSPRVDCMACIALGNVGTSAETLERNGVTHALRKTIGPSRLWQWRRCAFDPSGRALPP